MTVLDFILEMFFILFVGLMMVVGLLFAGAVIGGLFLLAMAAGGWILTTVQDWRMD